MGGDALIDRWSTAEIETTIKEGLKRYEPVCYADGCVDVVKRFLGEFLGPPFPQNVFPTVTLLLLPIHQIFKDMKYQIREGRGVELLGALRCPDTGGDVEVTFLGYEW